MWFKQLSIYPLNKAQLPALETLADKLAAAEFAPCMGLDWDSVGFAAPASFQPQEMVFAAQNTWRVALKKEEKVLPAAVVRDILDDKVQEIQNAEGRNVGRKEKQELKDNITDDLLPRAFTKSSRTEAVFDTEHGRCWSTTPMPTKPKRCSPSCAKHWAAWKRGCRAPTNRPVA